MRSEKEKAYLAYKEKNNAYRLMINTVDFDNQTIAQSMGSDYRENALAIITGESYTIETAAEYVTLIEELSKEDLGLEMNREILLAKRHLDAISCLSKEEVMEWSKLCSISFRHWVEAKKAKNYRLFENDLKELISFSKKIAYKRNPSKDPYDLYLDDFEEGMTKKDYDAFFNLIREELSPLVKKIALKQEEIDDSFLYLNYPIAKQKELSKKLIKFLNFDPSWGVLAISEHPFTSGFSTNDVRVTTAYNEHDISSNIYSIIHEVGHAFYEHQVKLEYEGMNLHTDISSGMHESQSRFFENYIGKRKSFIANIYPELQELFPEQLKDVSLDDFYRAVNHSRPSLIRTDADELTYPLHILVRYEIEKSIFDGTADLDHLDELWANKYEEYLGIRPSDDALGILQDVHWSDASFGYFPTYALGSALGAQLIKAMEKDIDIDKELEKGNFMAISSWLKDKIQRHGALYTFKEAVVNATGEEFNPQYYVDYLKKKYSELYHIED